MSNKQLFFVLSIIFGTIAVTLWIVSFIYKIHFAIPTTFNVWQFVFLALGIKKDKKKDCSNCRHKQEMYCYPCTRCMKFEHWEAI